VIIAQARRNQIERSTSDTQHVNTEMSFIMRNTNYNATSKHEYLHSTRQKRWRK